MYVRDSSTVKLNKKIEFKVFALWIPRELAIIFVQFCHGIVADVHASPGPVNPRLRFHPAEVPCSTVGFEKPAPLGGYRPGVVGVQG